MLDEKGVCRYGGRPNKTIRVWRDVRGGRSLLRIIRHLHKLIKMQLFLFKPKLTKTAFRFLSRG